MSADKEGHKAKASAKRGASSRSTGAEATTEDSLPARASELASDAWRSGESLLHEASNLVATVRQGQNELGERLSQGSKARPYLAIGTAVGAGFVLGGGLTVGLTRRLVMLGGRFALSMVVRKVVQNAGNMTA